MVSDRWQRCQKPLLWFSSCANPESSQLIPCQAWSFLTSQSKVSYNLCIPSLTYPIKKFVFIWCLPVIWCLSVNIMSSQSHHLIQLKSSSLHSATSDAYYAISSCNSEQKCKCAQTHIWQQKHQNKLKKKKEKHLLVTEQSALSIFQDELIA